MESPPIMTPEHHRTSTSSGCAILAGIVSIILGIWFWESLVDAGKSDSQDRPARTPMAQPPAITPPPPHSPANPEPSDPAPEPEPDHGAAAYYYGKAACEKALKSPSTAKFSSLADDHTGWKPYGYEQWKVFGYVDAQNSFGAMLRQNWLAVVKRYGGFYQVVYLRLGDDESGSMPGVAPGPFRELTDSEREVVQARMREAADDKRRESDAAIFTFHLERAQAGNDISQRRLAELYQARGDTNAAAAWLRAAITNSPAKP